MILPNKWFRTDYGQALRSSLAADGAVCRIINFGHSQVFDEATIYTCILVLTAQRNQTFALARSDANKQSLESAVFRIEDHSNLGDDAWTLGTSDESLLMSKLSGRGARLLDLPAAMSRGSSTGADTVFMVDKALVDQHGLEAGCLRVPVFATDFGRYHFVPASGVHVIYPYLEVENDVRILSEDELKSNFPGTYAYLSLKREELEKRKQTGAWYGYSAARNLELHNRAQIAIPLLASRGEFALIPGADRASLCPMAGGGFTITMDHEASLHPAVLLAILNSSLLFWALGQLSNVFRGGWITCTKQYFGELPIAVPNSEISSNLEALVTQILAAKTANPGADTTALEAEIDALVYQLYGLAPEDIAIVEGRTREK
jgi:hypothetical protein